MTYEKRSSLVIAIFVGVVIFVIGIFVGVACQKHSYKLANVSKNTANHLVVKTFPPKGWYQNTNAVPASSTLLKYSLFIREKTLPNRNATEGYAYGYQITFALSTTTLSHKDYIAKQGFSTSSNKIFGATSSWGTYNNYPM
jgi:lipopolysaccharide export LptBFGC system permease protein LptF